MSSQQEINQNVKNMRQMPSVVLARRASQIKEELQLVKPKRFDINLQYIRYESYFSNLCCDIWNLCFEFTRQQGVRKPYKEVIDVLSDDLHRTGMKPLTFVRQVSCDLQSLHILKLYKS